MPMIINDGKNFSGMTDSALLDAISKISTSKCTKYQIVQKSPRRNVEIGSEVIDTSKDDDLILEIKGSGRVLELLPLVDTSTQPSGTVVVLVDGHKYISKRIRYIGSDTSGAGYPILSNIVRPGNNNGINVIQIDGSEYHIRQYATSSAGLGDSFCNDAIPVVMPSGIAFSENLKVYMTTNAADANKCKLYATYELNV